MRIIQVKLPNGMRAHIRAGSITALLEGPDGQAFIYLEGSEAPIQTIEPFDKVLHAWKVPGDDQL